MKILITVKISDEQFKKIQDLGYDVVRISESKVTNSSETDDADILVCYNPFKTLDIEKMKKAAHLLCGTHDYTSFCGNRKFKKSAVRTVYRIDVEKTKDEIRLTYSGDGFLQNMIRILTGTLIEVGNGSRNPEEMTEILEARSI